MIQDSDKYEKLQIKFQKEVLDKLVKSDHVFGSYFGGPNRTYTSLNLCSCNRHYTESDYYYKEDLEFIHFTSQDKLKLILQTEQLRLFNLSSQNDKEEFKFAARVLGDQDSYHELSRKRIYSLSMCQLEILNDLTMWRLYAENTKGIALKIRISNDPEKWKKYHLSKVHYGEIEKIETYKIEKRQFEEKNNFRFSLNLDRFMAFHKSEHFKVEKEIRLIHFSEPNKKMFSFTPRPLKEKDFASHIEINLENEIRGRKKEIESKVEKPSIIITEIILGPNFDNDKLVSFIKNKIPEIPITESTLKNIYNA